MRSSRLLRALLPLSCAAIVAALTATCKGKEATAPAASALVFSVPPSSVAAGGWISPAVVVVVLDENGNTMTTSTAPVTVALAGGPSGAHLAGTLTAVAVAGVATFPWLCLDKAGGGYTLAASAPGLSPATSGSFSVTAGTPTNLAFVSQPSAATAGAAISPAVTVTIKAKMTH